MSSFGALKAANEARLSDEKRIIDRKRNLIVLMARYMMDNGYLESAERLQSEAGISLSRFDAADNISLLVMLQEFEAYFELRFGTKPKLIRRMKGDDAAGARRGGRGRRGAGRGRKPKGGRSTPTDKDKGDDTSPRDEGADGLGVVGSKAPSGPKGRGAGAGAGAGAAAKTDFYKERLLKPLPEFEYNPQMKELAAIVSRDIYQQNPNVHWDDVVQLDEAKRLLKEAVVMPVKYPSLFTGLLKPWKGILLYGPPGTGKTMLARAVATECRTTFFNISASTIVSKWRGDSEKLVRVLFDLARYHAPSTVFIDELDAIMGQRGSGGGAEHEASRRMKTELLIQMDGLMKDDSCLVFLLAASNLPWELDIAMLRRLEKRVHVGLPEAAAREVMLRKKLPPEHAKDLDYATIAAATEGFSGSDITLLCKECAMRPLRRVMARLESGEDTRPDDEVRLDPVTQDDVMKALETTRPSAHLFADRYPKWAKEFGSV